MQMTQSERGVKLLEEVEYGSLSKVNFQLFYTTHSSGASTGPATYVVAAQSHTEGKRKVFEAIAATETVVKKRQYILKKKNGNTVAVAFQWFLEIP